MNYNKLKVVTLNVRRCGDNDEGPIIAFFKLFDEKGRTSTLSGTKRRGDINNEETIGNTLCTALEIIIRLNIIEILIKTDRASETKEETWTENRDHDGDVGSQKYGNKTSHVTSFIIYLLSFCKVSVSVYMCVCVFVKHTPLLQDEQGSQLDQNCGRKNCQNLQTVKPGKKKKNKFRLF